MYSVIYSEILPLNPDSIISRNMYKLQVYISGDILYGHKTLGTTLNTKLKSDI
jgi:hypothetical protein